MLDVSIEEKSFDFNFFTFIKLVHIFYDDFLLLNFCENKLTNYLIKT